MGERDTVLLVGRDFTEEELLEVKETVRLLPRLNRTELAATICEHLGWATPAGSLKVESCLKLLEKLEKKGEIKLPPKMKTPAPRERRPIPTPLTDPPAHEVTGSLGDLEPIFVEPVFEGREMKLWNEYVERYHPLGYRRPFGAHQRYFILSGEGERLGCLLFSASAWALSCRDAWIGWTKEERSRRLHLVVSNSRFLIFPWVRVKNLASRALSLAASRMRGDWLSRYGYEPALLETFVDPLRYRGTCYLASNWIKLGVTAGRGRMDRHTRYPLTPKLVYVYPLAADFRARLLGR